MNVHNRVMKIERAFNISDSEANPLPEHERAQLIVTPSGCDKEKYIETEQKRILKELHDKYGSFDESSLTLISIIFV